MERIPRNLIQIGTLGDFGVGKTNLSSVFIDNKFITEHLSTIGINCLMKDIKVNIGDQIREIKVKIWDTAGQERFRSLSIQYIKSCLGVVLVYSIIDSKTLINIDNWIKELNEKKNDEQIFMILIGNKCDLEEKRQVTKEEGEKFALKYNLKFYECSAKKGINVQEAFNYLINDIINSYKDDFIDYNNNNNNNNNNNEEKQNENEKSGCCKRKKNKQKKDLKLNVKK